jgi:formylglycine-generating enzyme required for sulfatase activity
MIKLITVIRVFLALALINTITTATAQEVIIPDSGLNAAVRAGLNKPSGPLTRQDMLNLTVLNAHDRNISNLAGLEAARNLNTLLLFSNHLTSFSLPTLTNLVSLNLSLNSITNVALPAGMANLFSLILSDNPLAQLTLPADLTRLEELGARNCQLTSLMLPPGLTNLANLILTSNQLTNLTLPPDMTHLTSLVLDGNPLTRLVLSEPQATNLVATIVALQNRGIPVFKYPLTIQLKKQLMLEGGAFRFAITGPPGFYTVLSSTNLPNWSVLDFVNNPLGSVFFLDTTAPHSPQKFYRAQPLPSPPANLVFVPANTFLLGSPTNEVGHRADESPQTVVRLSRGYWIGKYEVTQRDYLAVTGENPSGFPGDLDRPVESVSFFAAANYCVLLTQQDLAAGRIPAGTHYRLPTEAEWECAARAGNTNRFYFGEDPSLSNLTNYAWFGAHNGITTHPVGLKLPNAWGLYDLAGNVWEWCQDWYGNYPGGTVTDPQGPATNPIGFKVIRGGAWESSEFDCRSASRWFEGASPFISDFIIGFRVVLVTD